MKLFIQKALLLPTLCFASLAVNAAEMSDEKKFGVSVGWMHIMPQGKAQDVSGDVLGRPIFSPNAGFEIKNADTAAILFDYYINDNVSLEFVGGYPPTMKIEGKGNILGGLVSLDQLGEVGDVEAYTPAVLAKYQFGTKEDAFRPFVGAGLLYAHFSNFELNSGTNQNLSEQMGFGQFEVQNVNIDDAIAPIVTLGADYNFNKSWFATASVSYTHLKTDASLDVNTAASMGGLGGKTIVSGKSEIEVNPIVTYLGLGYKF